MRLSALRWGFAGVAIAWAIALALAWTARVDEGAHASYAWALRRSLELDARLNEEVAKSRLGIVTHYDGLVRVGDEIAAVGAELAGVPSHVNGNGSATLEVQLAEYREALEEKQTLVESFKTEQSVLRNSLHAFPHNVDRLLAVLRPIEAPELEGAIARLEHDVMLLTLMPTRDLVDRARCDLVVLGADMPREERPGCGTVTGPVPVPAELEPELGAVMRHARVVIDRQAVVEDLVGRIMTLPVAARAADAADAYARIYRDATASSRTRWVVVFVLSVAVLVLGAAYIILRLHVSAVALRDTTGKLEAAMAQLERERDHEKELARLKSRFVSMTSHEFRTPLSVILSSSELLEAYWQRWTEEKRRSHFQRVQDAAKGMSKMLDGVLLIGRAEAGMLELNPQPLRLRELCDSLVEEMRTVAGDRTLDYVNEVPEEDVWMDEKLIRHVLTNLLSNAIKYSADASTVRFEVRQNGKAALFDVRDEGVGIPPEERGRLFEAFHRCTNATGIPGNGLGLAIVKKSLDVHGGSIEVESELGKGTRFHVRVPFVEEGAT